MFAKARRFPHLTAVLLALFVTFLWSTSWVIIKFGLVDIPPLTFAGLRYFLAFCCLLPVWVGSVRRRGELAPAAGAGTEGNLHRRPVLELKRMWWRLVVYGVVGYGVTQGAQFVGLAYLPAVTLNLLLGMTPVLVALVGLVVLGERPSGRQWLGVGLTVAGALIYFGVTGWLGGNPAGLDPMGLRRPAGLGLAVGLIGLVANAAGAILGRQINRERVLPALTVTVVSMGVGATLLLTAGLLLQGLPELSLHHWLMIGWLAVVNTALAFTLWNMSLRTLTAMESSVINSTMTVQIPVLAVLFLGERLTGKAVVGLAVAVVGTLLVQLGRRNLTQGR